MKSKLKNIAKELVVPFLSILLGLVICAVIIIITGSNPFNVYKILFSSSLGNLRNLGYTFFTATPLIFSGLAVAFAFQAGLFNIGVEGQLYLGAYVAAWVGYALAGLPFFLHLPLTILSAVLIGSLWGAIPGYIKAKTGANEVVNTIMMNFIASAFVGYMITNVFRHPEAAQRTPDIGAGAVLLRFSVIGEYFGLNIPKDLQLNMAFVLGIVIAFAFYIFLWKTSLGYKIRSVGKNPYASLARGINVPKIMTLSMAISGGIAGMTGLSDVLGYQHFFQEGFSPGYGFTGIAVALLGRNHPFGVILAALFFGALNRGALMVNIFTNVPQDLVSVLQAIIIFFAGCELIVRKILERRRQARNV